MTAPKNIPLYNREMYVLGPLEWAPSQFAVGVRSYIAIKGKMPYYNEMRLRFYDAGDVAAGDAIGELEARADTAENALERMTSARDSAESKIKVLTEEIKALKKAHIEKIKDLQEEFRLERQGKSKPKTKWRGVQGAEETAGPYDLSTSQAEVRSGSEPDATQPEDGLQ